MKQKMTEQDEYGKVKPLTLTLLTERGYYNHSSCGNSLVYRRRDNDKSNFWTSPAFLFEDQVLALNKH